MDYEERELGLEEGLETVEENLFSEEELDEDDGNRNGHAEDEAEEVPDGEWITKKQTKPVKPKKVVKNPQPKLNFERLQGPRGLTALNDMLKDFKFKGKGHEMEDLGAVLQKLEHWSNRLYPKFHFEDTLKRLESLGKKKVVQTYLRKIRLDMLHDDNIVQQFDDEEVDTAAVVNDDPFDELLADQITQTQASSNNDKNLTDEQRERIIRNRLLAEQRYLARLKASQSQTASSENVAVLGDKFEEISVDQYVADQYSDN